MVWFSGISTIGDYFMSNSCFTNILNISFENILLITFLNKPKLILCT